LIFSSDKQIFKRGRNITLQELQAVGIAVVGIAVFGIAAVGIAAVGVAAASHTN
jgi:hypothetical protein